MAYTNNRGPRGRQNHKSSNSGIIVGAIIAAMVVFFGTNLIPFALGSLFIGLDLLAIALPIIAIIYFIRKANRKNSRSQKKNEKRITTAEFLTIFKAHVPQSGRVELDNETYLQVEDPDNINLKTISIYMRDEYIATLNDYIVTFPSGYDALVNSLVEHFEAADKSRSSKKKNKEEVKEEPVIAKPKVTIEKGCDYYIKQFQQMNTAIANEDITKSLQTSIEYLQQINKIEKEYPDAKKKTNKLYQTYLPMYLDLLENYKKLANDVVDADEFKAQEDYFHKTAYLINNALETISSGLVDDYYTNFKVDMKTLESVLKKDGLVDTVEQND